METRLDDPTRGPASVQVWGKGYRVSGDSEEFQRYVPHDATKVYDVESRLGSIQWGRILEPLYGLSERELAAQRCFLVDSSEFMALSFARTEDRHRRPSIVMSTSTARIEWNDSGLGERVSRTVALAVRLAMAYAEAFRGNPETVGQQLRSQTFLPSREFDLSDETPDAHTEWPSVMAAVRLWRGVSGVSTPKLLSLGANVLLGTKHEADRAQQQHTIDGYFDVRDKQIRPLSPRLSRWAHQPEPLSGESTAVGYNQQPPDLRRIAESLDRIDSRLERLVRAITELLEYQFRGDKRRK